MIRTTPILKGVGGCPTFQIKATLKQGPAILGGRAEFGSQSAPPNYYRQVSWDGSGWDWDTYDLDSGGAHVSEVSFSGVGLSDYAFDPVTGWPLPGGTESDCTKETTEYPPYGSGTVTGHPLMEATITGLFEIVAGNVPSGGIASSLHDYFTGQTYFDMDFSIQSKTTAKFSMSSHSATISSPHTREDLSAGEIDLTLSDPDTEPDAYARAIAAASASAPISAGPDMGDIFTAGIFTLRETRSSTAFREFGCQAAQFQVVAGKVMPGVLYHVVPVFEARDAVGDGSGDDSGYGSTWTVWGALSYDKRGESDCTLTTDVDDFPTEAGKQIRLKSVTITPIDG